MAKSFVGYIKEHWALILTGFLVCLLFPVGNASAQGNPLKEYRNCGERQRTSDGRIKRRADVLEAFQKRYRCPATNLTTGSCPGWAIDHVIPLAVGGCDAVSNLQWLPNEIKSAKGKLPKDRWERNVYLVK